MNSTKESRKQNLRKKRGKIQKGLQPRKNQGNTKISKIRYAITHNPYLIPALFKDTSISKGMIWRILNESIPCRFGIEFELSGSFVEGYIKKHCKENSIRKKVKEVDISEDISVDEKVYSNIIYEKLKSQYKLIDYREDGIDDPNSINEVRISFDSPKSLIGLYDFMQDLREFCLLCDKGGIHIHVDISKYGLENRKQTIIGYLTNRLDEIGSIFPEYTGSYNKKSVGWNRKQTWVNVSRLDTLEFRIAPLTFDYHALMSWIIKLSTFRKKFVSDIFRVKRNKNTAVLGELIDNSTETSMSVLRGDGGEYYLLRNYGSNSRYELISTRNSNLYLTSVDESFTYA